LTINYIGNKNLFGIYGRGTGIS